jgi:hypothetical protein
MHPAILNSAQQSALAVLIRQPTVPSFYLAGGTALALHLGHRESVDFDFFRPESFDPRQLLEELPAPPRVVVLQEARDTLTVDFRGVKTSFFAYRHPLLKPLEHGPLTVSLASIPDIATMKLAAIAGRGSRKDFVDLYFICRQCFPLKEAFTYLHSQVYRTGVRPLPHPPQPDLLCRCRGRTNASPPATFGVGGNQAFPYH